MEKGEAVNIMYREWSRTVFIVGRGLAAVVTLIAIFLMPQVPLDRSDDEELREEGNRAE